MRKKVVFKLAELFSGPGGLALGAKNATVSTDAAEYSVEPVWANDIDADACKTYAKNIHSNNRSAVVCKPVQDIDVSEIPRIDALAFGFPCNDFSVVGEQKGIHGKYGQLYTYGIKVISDKHPLWFLAENVSGIQSANDGNTFIQIINELRETGYGYTTVAHIYKFEEYGVPQFRHRIVIVGIRKDLNLHFEVPAPTTAGSYVTARQALECPPIKPDATNNELTRQSVAVVNRLKYIPPGQNAWYEGIPHDIRLKVKSARLSQIYKRLDPNKPSYTITGSGGGGTHGYHWSENRALTNRERARLQTFPDSFAFIGSKESVRKQIGMAVPPVASQIIIDAILKTFAGIKYNSVEPRLQNGSKIHSLGCQMMFND